MAEGGEGGESDDEWDIERAVENRVVQVMFTVPKEKLRVVNQDVEEESEVGSLRSRKGSGRRSVKDLFGITTGGEEGSGVGLDEKRAEGASEPLLEDMDEKEEERESPRARERERGKGKVLELVEKIEAEHSPTRS
jgi:hypothetical protein